MVGESVLSRIRKQFRLTKETTDDARLQRGADDIVMALEHFAELLPAVERPAATLDLLDSAAATNAFDPLRIQRDLPVKILFYAHVHPAYFEGDTRIDEAAWRLCYTDGGAVSPSPARARLLDEVIRLAEAMHDKNPFGEVPFDGGKTILLQEGSHFQAVTALFGTLGMSLFILAKGGLRYYSNGPISTDEKRTALERWAQSSVLAGVLAQRYIAGPDMRMGEEEMVWVDAAAREIGTERGLRLHPPVTGLAAEAGGFPHQTWELTGRTVAASLREALHHPGMAYYGLAEHKPIRVLIQGFGDVGGSVARLLTEEAPTGAFQISGIADEFGAVYRAEGLDVPALLRRRAARRPIIEYTGPVDALWINTPSATDEERPGFRGRDGREMIAQESDVFIPAAIPNVVDAALAERLRVKLIAEGANNAVVPKVEDVLHRLRILYLPGQALNWGGVKSSTLEALFRESTKCRLPFIEVEQRVRAALAPLGTAVDLGWTLNWLRSGLPGPPLDSEETRAFAIAILEDLARSNTRWLMRELVSSGHQRTPLELVRSLARGVRSLKVQLLSLVEQGLGKEFFDAHTSLPRQMTLLDERLKELLFDAGIDTLTSIQVAEQRQMLQQLQTDLPNGLSPVFASLLAALDLARQKVMDSASYTRSTLEADLQVLRRPDAPPLEVETSLSRLQRVHPGLHRVAFTQALARLISEKSLSPILRRNAALALAKLGSGDPHHRRILQDALADPDLSVRAACRWTLHQMAIPSTNGEPAERR
jgi:glutamate dehydrogenase/leucine dehydrogenase